VREALRRIGPGLVLAASIVGSGELIATTTLGAQVGYSALWIIVLSCAIKPVVQAELGRYTIASGETGLEALDHLPGPRLGVGWLVWAWAALVLMRMPQYFHWSGLAEGLRLKLPPQGVATAAAVFGITGVGATELFMYPYWCVEKGYARFVYWLFASPVKMVIGGGISQALMLPLVGAGAVWLRHRRLPPELAPSPAVTAGLWAAAIFMAGMMAYYAWLIGRQA
jgi:hypothetical protein